MLWVSKHSDSAVVKGKKYIASCITAPIIIFVTVIELVIYGVLLLPVETTYPHAVIMIGGITWLLLIVIAGRIFLFRLLFKPRKKYYLAPMFPLPQLKPLRWRWYGLSISLSLLSSTAMGLIGLGNPVVGIFLFTVAIYLATYNVINKLIDSGKLNCKF